MRGVKACEAEDMQEATTICLARNSWAKAVKQLLGHDTTALSAEASADSRASLCAFEQVAKAALQESAGRTDKDRKGLK